MFNFSLLSDPEFSDMSLVVGGNAEIFKVHKAIICQNSDFFRAACKNDFKEKREGIITLSEIQPDILRIVLKWIYESEYTIDGYNVVDVFISADFLQMQPLKTTIFQAIIDDINSPNKGAIGEPEEILRKLSEIATEADLMVLTRCIRDMIANYVWGGDQGLKRHFERTVVDQGKTLYCRAALGAQTEILDILMCAPCRKAELGVVDKVNEIQVKATESGKLDLPKYFKKEFAYCRRCGHYLHGEKC